MIILIGGMLARCLSGGVLCGKLHVRASKALTWVDTLRYIILLMRAHHKSWSSYVFGFFLTVSLVFGAALASAQTPATPAADKESPNLSLNEKSIKIEATKLTPSADAKRSIKFPNGDNQDPTMDKLYNNTPWIKISAEFTTVFKLTPSATFTFYVEGYDPLQTDESNPSTYMTLDYSTGPTGKAKFVVLKGETTLLNIPAGTKHIVAMYIHPSMVNRYGGKSGLGDDFVSPSKKNNIRVEATDIGGKVFPIDYKTDDPDWVKKAEETIDRGLLNVMQTPFWPFDFRQYNQIQPSSSK